MAFAARKEPTQPHPHLSTLKFFFLWLRRPARLGAVVPSGGPLARAMAGEIDSSAAGAVVELGGGTGTVTQALLDAGVPAHDLIVIEREHELYEILKARFPYVRVVKGDARDLRRLLAEIGVRQVKAVASCLPLLSMPDGVRAEIVGEAFAVLDPAGSFLQFTYGPASPVPRRHMRALGLFARRARWILLNLPPASVWSYRRAVAA